MNKEESGINQPKEFEIEEKVRNYASVLNTNITREDLRTSLLRGIKQMQEGKGDKDVRNGQFGRFTDDELGKLYDELIFKHKWPKF